MLKSQIHKRINFNFEKQKLIFDSSRLLFSFAKVDDGTKMLLNSLRKNPELNYKKTLDLGCGYGVMGIFIKKSHPESYVSCTDRDSLAIEFTKHNAELNNVKIDANPSLDFENIKDKFSLIVCNFPAKLEKNGLKYFIEKSSEFLEDSGMLAIVIVKELEKDAEEILKNEKINIKLKEKNNNYAIYHISFNKQIATNTNPYITKDEHVFDFIWGGGLIFTTEAMQEFDTTHFNTDMIIELLKKINYDSVTIINPGQGHTALASASKKSLDKITLVSKDLLQLKISSDNLKLNAINRVELINKDLYIENSDLLIWSLRDEDYGEILEKMSIYRSKSKNILLAGKKNILSKIVKKMNIIPKREIQKGKYVCYLILSS